MNKLRRVLFGFIVAGLVMPAIASAAPSIAPFPKHLIAGTLVNITLTGKDFTSVAGGEIAVWDPVANPSITPKANCTSFPGPSGGTQWVLINASGANVTYILTLNSTISIMSFGLKGGALESVNVTTAGGAVVNAGPYRWKAVGDGVGNDNTSTIGTYIAGTCGEETTGALPYQATDTFETHNVSTVLTKSVNMSKVEMGGMVMYTYNESNTGGTDITNLTIVDPGCPSSPIISSKNLTIGQTLTFTCNATLNTPGYVNNTAVAHGTPVDPVSGTLFTGIDAIETSNTVTVKVINPNITVAKSCTPASQIEPGTITWKIVTKNTGNADLSNVMLVDTRSTIGNITIGPLASGASNTTTVKETSLPIGNYSNTVTATGTDQLGKNVSATSSSNTCRVIPLPPMFNISGYKINDTDGNGVWDPGEMGIPGWNITLSNTTMTKTIATNADGFYIFTKLLPGNYTLREEDKPMWNHTNASSKSITLVDRDLTNLNFTNNLTISICPVVPGAPGTISGCKFNDLNGNGKQDPGEPGLANWTIRLSGYDTLTRHPVSRTTVTDANGFYQFTDVTPGFYTVCENSMPNWKPITSACKAVRLPNQTASVLVDFANRCSPSRQSCPPT